MQPTGDGPDPRRVHEPGDLARELGLLRGRAARGSRRARVSLDQLAGRVGLPRSTVHAYVTGKHLVPSDVLDQIVIALGASPAEQRGWSEAWFRLSAASHRCGPPLPALPRQLPCDVDGFTGRSRELAELDRAAARPGPAVVAVAGTGGVGKTALVVHWAHRVAGDFPDGHLWVDLRGFDAEHPVSPPDALAGFLRALGVTGAAIPHDLAERAALYRSLLAGRRMLVLLDNAHDADQVRPLLPGGPSCLTVVSSRDSLAGLVAGYGARRLELDLLPLGDAVTLLRRLASDRVVDRDGDAVMTVARQCARLPLALRVAAERFGISRTMTVRDLADDLANERSRLDMLDAGDDPRTAVRAVFHWSYRHLPPGAARAFRLAGLHPGHELGELAAAALFGTDLGTARRQLGLLVRAHLIQQVAPGRYAMHDLLRAWAAERAAEDGGAARQATDRMFGFYLHATAEAVDVLYPAERRRRPSVPLPPTEPARFSGAPAARSWLDAEVGNIILLAHRAAQDGGPPAVTTRLSALLWRHLDVGCHHAEASRLHGLALAAAERTGDVASQAIALNNLGVLHWRLGRHESAVAHLERALQCYRRAGDPAGECRALNNLGAVHWQLGQGERAERHYRQALEVAAVAGEATTQAVAVHNLGIVHSLAGRHGQAAECCRQALDGYRRLGDRVGEASAIAGLGVVACRTGDSAEAEARFRAALDIARQLNGLGIEARVLGHLGGLYERTGRYEEAAEHHRLALALQRRAQDLVGEADSLAGLAAVCARLARADEAIEHASRALALSSRIDHRYGLATASNALGEASLAAGDPAAAAAAFRAAGGHAAAVGDRYEQGRALDGLGCALHGLGEITDAVATWRRAAVLFRELGVPDSGRVERRPEQGLEESGVTPC